MSYPPIWSERLYRASKLFQPSLIKKLEGEPLIFFDRALNPVLYQKCVTQFEDSGFSPNIVMETNQVSNGLSMVRDGMGFMFVASYVARDLDDSLIAVPISDFPPISVVAVWHEDNRSKALKTYLEQLRSLL